MSKIIQIIIKAGFTRVFQMVETENYIQPKPVYAFAQPPTHHFMHLGLKSQGCPIQIHLLFRKKMQRPYILMGVVIPSRAAKKRRPFAQNGAALIVCFRFVMLIFLQT